MADVKEVKVKLVNGSIVKSSYSGKVMIATVTIIVALSTVYFVPNLQLNLLSCFGLDQCGITIINSNRTCILIEKERNINEIGRIPRRKSGGLHVVRLLQYVVILMKNAA